MKFLLIFLSSCTFGQYDCVHEIIVYETYADCAQAQAEHDGYHTVCAFVTERNDREFDIESLGEPDGLLSEEQGNDPTSKTQPDKIEPSTTGHAEAS